MVSISDPVDVEVAREITLKSEHPYQDLILAGWTHNQACVFIQGARKKRSFPLRALVERA